jgi:hypothetical protein
MDALLVYESNVYQSVCTLTYGRVSLPNPWADFSFEVRHGRYSLDIVRQLRILEIGPYEIPLYI